MSLHGNGDSEMRSKWILRLIGGALVCALLAAVTRAEELENLARKATVTANSEYSADFQARWAVDGKIPAACCKQDHRQAWCVRGSETKCTGEFTLTWETPVEVAEIVYFGRTGQLIEECFKDYEVYLDDAAKPAVRGAFEMRHGAQRIRLPRATVGKIRIAFLSAYTNDTNPGASEIAVFGSPPTSRTFTSTTWRASGKAAGSTSLHRMKTAGISAWWLTPLRA